MEYKVHILAHNEEKVIEDCIRSVLMQRVAGQDRLSVTVIANGCSDNTEQIVTMLSQADPRISLHVIKGSGKVNALRSFLEQFFAHLPEPANDELLFFMDADVEISGPTALSRLADNLLADRQLFATSAHCIPESVYNKKMDFVSCLFRVQSRMHDALRPNIFRGMLYCIRTKVMQQMVFPPNLLSDDICLEICLDGHFKTDYEVSIVYKLHQGLKRELRRNFMHCFVVLQAYRFLKEKQITRVDHASAREAYRIKVLQLRDILKYLLVNFDPYSILILGVHLAYYKYNVKKARQVLDQHGTQGMDYQVFWKTRN
jgi:glycosyltransferase involved in cell wall biosynthesis